jgi:hypothetical protein
MNKDLKGIVRRVVHPHVDHIAALKVSKEAGAIDQVWMSPALLGWMCWEGKKWRWG